MICIRPIVQKSFAGRKDKYVSLMDIALMAMRKLKKDGKLDDQEETDEINGLQYYCSC